MLLRSFYQFILLLATLTLSFSSFSSESCPASGVVYQQNHSMQTGGSHYFYVNYFSLSCQIKATGVILEINGVVTADWVYTSEKFLTYKITNEQGLVYYSKDNQQISDWLIRNYPYENLHADRKYTPYGYTSLLPGADCRFIRASKHSGGVGSSQRTISAIPVYYCEGPNRDGGISSVNWSPTNSSNFKEPVVKASWSAVYEKPTCSLGLVFNYETNSCDVPPRVDSDSCTAGFTHKYEYIKGRPPEDVNYNNCHMSRISIDTNMSMPSNCYSVVYETTGKAARSSDYVMDELNKNDFCDFTPPVCDVMTDYVYSGATGLCHAKGYHPYHPTEINNPANWGYGCWQFDSSGPVYCDISLLEIDPSNTDEYENSGPVDHDSPDLSNPNSDRDMTCKEMNSFTYCNYDDNSDPVELADYPDGSSIDPDLCRNGFSGSSCDHNSLVGGSIPRDSGSDVTVDMSQTNSALSQGFNSMDQGLGDINNTLEGMSDYLEIDEELDTGGLGDYEVETQTIDPHSDIANSEFVKNGLNFGDTCPSPKSMKIFEGVSFFGKSMEDTIYLKYDAICEVGFAYRKFFIAIFVFFLLIDLVRRVA